MDISNTDDPVLMGNLQNEEELAEMANKMLQSAGCSNWQTEHFLGLFSRINSIPWGTASKATDKDDWDVHAFVERLNLDEGLLEKGLIVSDHSDRGSRWQTLGTLLSVESPWHKTRLAQPNLEDVVETMQEWARAGYLAQAVEIQGKPSYLRFWRRPGLARSLRKLGLIFGMTATCVGGMTVRTLIEDESSEDHNPYEALFQIFERGLLLDWDNWRYTNMSLDDLGRIPEPML